MQRESPAGRREGVAIPARPGDDGANLSRPEATMTPNPPLSVKEAAELFGLLGQPARLRMLLTLRDRGEACVTDVAAWVGQPQSTVSKHLAMLRAEGVVGRRRAGQRVFYRITSPPALLLLREVEEG
jgi:DNA-binding transcriptional ArsR family regulator